VSGGEDSNMTTATQPTITLTDAHRRALEVMANSTRYVDSGPVTEIVGKYGEPLVSIPYRAADGSILRTKIRTRKGTFWLKDGVGTPLYGQEALDPLEFVRTIAVARITMPKARVRLSAGRRQLGEGVQALCYLAGANSIFYGDKLLVTGNPEVEEDRALLSRIGMRGRQV
jgi:hypothetical protein